MKKGKIAFNSPSNIAIIKYWGKFPGQIPANPSISFTLENAVTEMFTDFSYASDVKNAHIELFFEGEYNLKFTEKIRNFVNNHSNLFPLAAKCNLKIQSANSFPHSAGIASSASSMSALALTLSEIERLLSEEKKIITSETVSNIARLASGSACRSIYGGIVLWGKTSLIENSSDNYAIPLTNNIHSVFTTYKDVILLVDSSEKNVSSRAGHALMEKNPYSLARYTQANSNLKLLLNALKNGDLDLFCKIAENEALSLHALMMQSDPWYMLMKPNTLKIIHEIKLFREQNKIPVCFTLDAGPNVHVLFPENVEKEIMKLINYLSDLCGEIKWLKDGIGKGPKQLKIDNEYN